MKHDIANKNSYFDELDNYDYVIDFNIPFVQWSIYGTDSKNLDIDSPQPCTYLHIGGDFYKLQEYIDSKKIIVAGEQTSDEFSLYPIIEINHSDSPVGDYILKMKIFYHSDMHSEILKLKLCS